MNRVAEITVARRPRLARTETLRSPTQYVAMMANDFFEWVMDEDRAPLCRGRWREQVFRVNAEKPLDLEIGTGNGLHFAHRAVCNHSQRLLLGVERKYKPLVQSIRRAIRAGGRHVRMIRYDGSHLGDIFAEEELDNVYIHFPDPWAKPRQWKHRLIQDEFLSCLYRLQRKGSWVDFKTDSAPYFEWAVQRFERSPYKLIRMSRHLHQSAWQDENFVTQFENLFKRQGSPIHYARWIKES